MWRWDPRGEYRPIHSALVWMQPIGPMSRSRCWPYSGVGKWRVSTFEFVDQGNPQSYKQLGNGVNVGAVYNVIRAQVVRDLDLLEKKTELTRSILGAPANPDVALESHKKYFANHASSKGLVKQEISKLRKTN